VILGSFGIEMAKLVVIALPAGKQAFFIEKGLLLEAAPDILAKVLQHE